MFKDAQKKYDRKKHIKPLYRKVNTHARNVNHHFGGDFRHDRHSKRAEYIKMAKDVQRGLDYTHLFQFLLSKVGQKWDQIYSQAIKRLDKSDPIFYMVARQESDKKEYFRAGDSTYFSGLYVDESGLLQKVAPELGPESLRPFCSCCTHTFNGFPFTKRFGSSTDVTVELETT